MVEITLSEMAYEAVEDVIAELLQAELEDACYDEYLGWVC